MLLSVESEVRESESAKANLVRSMRGNQEKWHEDSEEEDE